MKQSKSKQSILVMLLMLIFVAFLPGIYLFSQNVFEMDYLDGIKISLLYLIFSSIVFGLSLLITRNTQTTTIIGTFISIFILNYEIIATPLKNTSNQYIYTSIIGIGLLCLIIFLLWRFPAIIEYLSAGLLIFMCVMIFVNILPAIPKIVKKITIINQYSTSSDEIAVSSHSESDNPNIYYVIWDEYGGPENLKEYYDYDNHELYDYLSGKGFNYSLSSKNEEGFSTVTIVPNLLNLDYVVKNSMSAAESKLYLKQPAFYKLLKKNGYTINVCSFPTFLDMQGCYNLYGSNEYFEEQAGYYILKNSAFIHLYDSYNKKHSENKDWGTKIYEALEAYMNTSKLDKTQSYCNIGYFQAPHSPFYFDKEGNPNPQELFYDWGNKELYINNIKWTNKQIENMVETILTNDPNSIIVFQSDHGARYARHMYEDYDIAYTAEDTEPETSVINFVYYKGEELDIEGLSGLNTLRAVLNKQFNTTYDMLICPGLE